MLEFDPLDEYPIHQVPLPMRYVGPSDRNFYDRCIYQGVDHEGDVFFITGLGVYPNLGVIDAYATVRRGDRQWAVRASGSRPDDKLQQAVGPYRIEPASVRGRASCVLMARASRSRRRASPRPATGPGESGPSARPSHPAGRASSTACGGTGSPCGSTTSCCT